MQIFNLSDKVALVTGGAGLLGEMHSEAIVENGGKVVVGDLNFEAAQRVCDNINSKYPNKAFAVRLNVLDKKSIETTLQLYPNINVLINNAAIDPKVTDKKETVDKLKYDFSVVFRYFDNIQFTILTLANYNPNLDNVNIL